MWIGLSDETKKAGARRTKDKNKIQDTLLVDKKVHQESEVSPLEDVIKITPNICIEKNVCGGCGRGDHYGIPLHFIFHLEDGSIKTVCYACSKKAADKTGLKLPRTESDIFASDEEADMRLIRIARHKMEAKNGNI